MADNDENKSRIEKFYGVYRGFSPTDESDVGMGELEIIIDKDFVKWRMATGHCIHEEEFPSSELNYISKESLIAMSTKPDSKEVKQYAETVTAFGHGNMKYIFQPAPPEYAEYSLLVSGSMGDILGPTALAGGPSGVREEIYEKIIKELVDAIGGEKEEFPTLANNGRALKE